MRRMQEISAGSGIDKLPERENSIIFLENSE
jgi:hypothetical protein